MAADPLIDPLILAIQEGVTDERPWNRFVPLLREALGATYANLVFRRIEGRPAEEVEISSGDAPSWVPGRYIREFSHRDPIAYFQMQPGRVYGYEELAGTDDPFRRDFLLPAGFAHFLIFRVAEPMGCNVWITATREAAAAPFGAG